MTFSDDLRLHSPRLLLRPLVAGDAQDLLGWMSDAELMRYWSHAPWTELAQAEAAIAQDAQDRRSGQALKLGISLQASGELLGYCVVFHIDVESRRAEIGYCLASAAQGQGLMHEAMLCFLDYLLGELKLRRLEAEIDPRNRASARTLELLGFVQEGLLRERWSVAHEISDSALYGLLAHERAARLT